MSIGRDVSAESLMTETVKRRGEAPSYIQTNGGDTTLSCSVATSISISTIVIISSRGRSISMELKGKVD